MINEPIEPGYEFAECTDCGSIFPVDKAMYQAHIRWICDDCERRAVEYQAQADYQDPTVR